MKQNTDNNMMITTKESMMIKKYQFLYLIYLVFIRYMSNIMGVFFGLVFPIVWLIASYYIWGT